MTIFNISIFFSVGCIVDAWVECIPMVLKRDSSRQGWIRDEIGCMRKYLCLGLLCHSFVSIRFTQLCFPYVGFNIFSQTKLRTCLATCRKRRRNEHSQNNGQIGLYTIVWWVAIGNEPTKDGSCSFAEFK